MDTRQLQSSGPAPLWGNLSPAKAAAARAALWGVITLVITDAIMLLTTTTDWHDQWKPLLIGVLVYALRQAEGLIDAGSAPA